MNAKLYLIKLSHVWVAYSSTVRGREISKETAAIMWKDAYWYYADGMEVIDAPERDADGNPFVTAWGRTYRKTRAGGFKVHAKGRA